MMVKKDLIKILNLQIQKFVKIIISSVSFSRKLKKHIV